MHQKADLVVAPLGVEASREHVMDFTMPYMYVPSSVILKEPDQNTNKWLTLVSPFRFEVHICILLVVVFSTVILFGVEELYPVGLWTENTSFERLKRYITILWCHLGAVTANGGVLVKIFFALLITY